MLVILDFSPNYHVFFEALAYFIGFRVFLWNRKRYPTLTLSQDLWIWLAIGAILGAGIGSKLVFWAQDPEVMVQNWRSISTWLGGKTVVGGFLGGVLGVELAKKWHGIASATGDVFVLPMSLGLMIGRLGCFAAGLSDRTYGTESQLPWAVDFGDGLTRHPTQLYELVFVAVWLGFIRALGKLDRQGDAFKLMMGGYLVFRLLVDSIKPVPYAYFGWASAIQLACLAGLGYYGPHCWRILRIKIRSTQIRFQ